MSEQKTTTRARDDGGQAAMTERPILFSAPMVRAILDDRKTQTRRIVKPQPSAVERWKGGQPTTVTNARNAVLRDASGKGWACCGPFKCPLGEPAGLPRKFRDASPPSNGWYLVRWEPGMEERMVWLVRVPDEPQDETADHDVERWVWGKSPEDDPENVCLDIREPLDIEWRRPGDRLWVRETWAMLRGATELVTFEGQIPERWPKSDSLILGMVPAPFYRADGERPDVASGNGLGKAWKWRPSIHMPRWAARLFLDVLDVRIERLCDISEEDARAEGFGSRAEFLAAWASIYGAESWAANPWVWVVEFRRLP